MLTPEEPTFIVTIHYKSGAQFVGRFSKFNVKQTGTGAAYEWVSKPNHKYPEKFLLFGADEVEFIHYHEEE